MAALPHVKMQIAAEHLPPRFVKALYDGGIKGVVEKEDHILTHGIILLPIEAKLKVGQQFVLLPALKGCILQYQSDIDEYNRQMRLKSEAKRQGELELAIARANDFWRKYQIPFKFGVEIKESLSGLSATGMGNGQKQNTVYHLYCQEQVQEDRIVRNAGSFLCTQPHAKYGGNWSGTLGNGITLPYTPPITCKQCLKMMERWKKKIKRNENKRIHEDRQSSI